MLWRSLDNKNMALFSLRFCLSRGFAYLLAHSALLRPWLHSSSIAFLNCDVLILLPSIFALITFERKSSIDQNPFMENITLGICKASHMTYTGWSKVRGVKKSQGESRRVKGSQGESMGVKGSQGELSVICPFGCLWICGSLSCLCS